MLCSRCKCEIEENPLTIEQGIVKACEFFKIDRDKLISKRQDREVARPRMMLMKYLWEEQDHSLKTIAVALGKRHHSTVIHAREAIGNDIETNCEIAIQYNQFLNYING